jgi:hypothetical protein
MAFKVGGPSTGSLHSVGSRGPASSPTASPTANPTQPPVCNFNNSSFSSQPSTSSSWQSFLQGLCSSLAQAASSAAQGGQQPGGSQPGGGQPSGGQPPDASQQPQAPKHHKKHHHHKPHVASADQPTAPTA